GPIRWPRPYPTPCRTGRARCSPSGDAPRTERPCARDRGPTWRRERQRAWQGRRPPPRSTDHASILLLAPKGGHLSRTGRMPVSAASYNRSISGGLHHRPEDVCHRAARLLDRDHANPRVRALRKEDEAAHRQAGPGDLLAEVEAAQLVDDLLIGLGLRGVEAADGADRRADAGADRRARARAASSGFGRADHGTRNGADDAGEQRAGAGALEAGGERGGATGLARGLVHRQ